MPDEERLRQPAHSGRSSCVWKAIFWASSSPTVIARGRTDVALHRAALHDDGMLNVVSLRKTSVVRKIRTLQRIYSGKHIGMRGVDYFLCRRLTIEGAFYAAIAPDGEFERESAVYDDGNPRGSSRIHSIQIIMTMTKSFSPMRRFHYESRMFISLAIVTTAGFLFGGTHRASDPLLAALARLLNAEYGTILSFAFVAAACAMLVATLLRMCRRNAPDSQPLMAFPVQDDRLVTNEPYQLVRNPIYLADMIAVTGAGLTLGFPGF